MTDVFVPVTLEFGRYGFWFAGLGYLLFWALLLTVKTNNAQKILLSIYTLVCIGWAYINSHTEILPFSNHASFILENLQKYSLALFLFAALSRSEQKLSQLLWQPKLRLVLATFVIWLVAGLFVSTQMQLLAALILTVVLLAMVEAIYRQAGIQKWQFKPLVIAVAGSVLFDFYLLAEAALLGEVNRQTWQARGYVHVMMLPFLVVAVKRIKSWGINVYVSRDIVLQSSMVLGAGIYLCILAVVGYYLSYFGGDWTTLLQVVFVVSGCVVLSVLLFSNSIRRKSKVFIEKHFFANTFDYRLKWVELSRQLKQIEIVDQNAPQVCLQAWCQAIGYSHGALIKFTQDDAPILLAHTLAYQPDSQLLLLIQRYQREFSHKYWLLDFSDTQDEHVNKLLSETGLTQNNSLLLVPIQQKSRLWGCCLLKPEVNEKLKLNWELRDYMSAVSEQISSYLFMSEASKELSENAQFVAFSRMSAFVVHDLKNIKAQIDMLLKNAERHRHNPEFIDDAFTTIEAMQQRLHNMLSQLTNKQAGTERLARVKVGAMLGTLLAQRCQAHTPVPTLQIIRDCELLIDSERFSNVIFHLVDNAQQATPDLGSVTLTLDCHDQFMQLEISDTGCGMSEEFIRERLFKPFDTTKGNAGMGIGAYDAQSFIVQNGGRLMVQSKLTIGSTFTIRLPLN
ncbi:XrtA/PEP-CTERM system histidine kinase PrsK [Rheinheimera sp. 4Y26]|uniref:XrtA/PEP-CTERM system histidine kinase PrsK n=1 Tax=Rheinheimera sp. 4Y26 TaxID=2977811 RepID=UPI0021B09DEC|nr:XrtA/PEP-CTERM system histidine kinase PrsK [Rheinheimera sp. 4Y26]MCT6699055.1 PEP-CTERM system histidine kinase PrsK [Rheinheimera sp. 4Y26]